MKHAVILMTALLPTEGHRDLVEFAASLTDTHVWALINGRTHEPLAGETRVAAVSEAFATWPNVTVRLAMDDEAPQNPDGTEAFWDWWRDQINRAFPEVKSAWTYVVASEPYGARVAQSLEAEFLPYDIGRELNPTRSTPVREDLWSRWGEVLPAARRELGLKATVFGPESVGKTTVSKLAAHKLEATWLFEYARPYLETVGPEVTVASMAAIWRGQAALQRRAYRSAARPAIIMDTDLFTTVGYYPLMPEPIPPAIVAEAHALAADVYYLLSDAIPFEEDPLRYGGDHRESTSAYWESLLEREGLLYVRVPLGTAEEEATFIAADVRRRFEEKNAALANFLRE